MCKDVIKSAHVNLTSYNPDMSGMLRPTKYRFTQACACLELRLYCACCSRVIIGWQTDFNCMLIVLEPTRRSSKI